MKEDVVLVIKLMNTLRELNIEADETDISNPQDYGWAEGVRYAVDKINKVFEEAV